MALEPKNFFVGLTDFFTILLPGTILVHATVSLLPGLAAIMVPGKSEAVRVGALLVSGYVAGHFVFMTASKLDDWLYDPLNDATPLGLIAKVADGKCKGAPGLVRQLLARWLLGDERKRFACLRRAKALRDLQLGAFGHGEPVNTFQWSKAWLIQRDFAGSVAQIERYEADSKFFRSFFVVIVALASLIGARFGFESAYTWFALFLAIVLGAFSLKRYCSQRVKAIEHTYRCAFIAASSDPTLAASIDPGGSATKLRAGGVVMRERKGVGREILLVSASDGIPKSAGTPPDGATRWVLPKGKVRPFESNKEAAVREVLEESGVLAQPTGDLGVFSFGKANERKRCHYFKMSLIAENEKPEVDRFVRWVTPAEAKALNLKADIAQVIEAASE